MLKDILSFLESIWWVIDFIIEYLFETIHLMYLAVVYVVESVAYVFTITPFVPYNIVIVFAAMIVISVIFLIFGRQK